MEQRYTEKAVAIFDRNARLYQQNNMDVTRYHVEMDRFCTTIVKDTAHILDVGCGPGNVMHYMARQRPGWQWLGIDLSPQMLALAAANNPAAQFQQLDIRNIASLKQKFDGIVFGFCFPYCDKDTLVQMLQESAGMLHEGGAIYLSTMEGKYDESKEMRNSVGDLLLVYDHEESYIKEALEQSGFEVLLTERKKYIYADRPVTDLVMVAIRK